MTFLPRDATQSAVMPQYVVCLSVRPSVTLRHDFHTGCITTKIISRPNSLRPLLGLTPTWASWCNGNTPKLGWNGGGVTQKHKNMQYLRNGARYDQGYYYGLIGSHIRAFDWCQNQRPRMTLTAQSFKVPLLSQERGKLQTSNLAGTFIRSIQTKAHKKIGRKGRVGISRDFPKFLSTPYYLTNG